MGEEALDAAVDGGWHHAAQSVRIYEVLEPRNLSWEVRDGLRAHTWRITPPPATPEGACVRFADRIAYLAHDTLDALRAGLLRATDLPGDTRAALGPPSGSWIGLLVDAVLDESARVGEVRMDSGMAATMDELRTYLFERVYHSEVHAADRARAQRVVTELVEHVRAHSERIPDTYRDPDATHERQVVDYVAGMTDRFALRLHGELFGADAPRPLRSAS